MLHCLLACVHTTHTQPHPCSSPFLFSPPSATPATHVPLTMQRSDDVLSLASVVLRTAQQAPQAPSCGAPRSARSPTRHAGLATMQQQLREAEEALEVVRRVPPKRRGRATNKGPTPAVASHPGLVFGAVGAPIHVEEQRPQRNEYVYVCVCVLKVLSVTCWGWQQPTHQQGATRRASSMPTHCRNPCAWQHPFPRCQRGFVSRGGAIQGGKFGCWAQQWGGIADSQSSGPHHAGRGGAGTGGGAGGERT